MCVTIGKASHAQTAAYTYATLDTTDPRTLHVTGYTSALYSRNDEGPNCMVLHIPGNELRLVQGPEQTHTMMDDIAKHLPALKPEGYAFKETRLHPTSRGFEVALAEHSSDMYKALEQIPADVRPELTERLEKLFDWYNRNYSDYSFVLACFDGLITPEYPIVVEYVPHNDDVLFVPGLVALDGNPPDLSAAVVRNHMVAFGAEGYPQPIVVDYRDPIDGAYWAPHDVTGFYDNTTLAANQDYVLALETINEGFIGNELVPELIS